MTKKLFVSTCVFLCLALATSVVRAQTKVDPFFKALSNIQTAQRHDAKASSLKSGGSVATLVDAFIKVADMDAAIDVVMGIGGSVRTVLSDSLMTANVPFDALDVLEEHDSIIFVEAAKPITVKNDVAMEEMNGYEVHSGLDMPQGYTGAGVIMGIVDTGIDLGHSDFTDADGNSRVLFAWDQQSYSGFGPSELIQTYGTECDADKIASGTCPMRDTDGHGTHIAGTAAGRDETYGGVAPDANIIAVRYKSELIIDGYANPVFSTTICEAAFYVFKKAESLGRPAVVNLSLGTHIGAHDGTSLFEQCLDGLVEGSSGRAIVAAAGNEHLSHTLFKGLHAGYDVSGDVGSNFRIRSLTQGRVFYLDTWMTSGSDLSFGIVVRDTSSGTEIGSTSLVSMGDATSGYFDGDNIAWQIDNSETASPLNGRPHAGITIILDNDVTNPEGYDFDLRVSGSGHIDAWWYPDKSSSSVLFTNLEGDSGNGYTYVPGDDRMNVAIPATARNVIAVGGYASRTEWDRGNGCCQVAFQLGAILPFSSIGPSANPDYTGQKPEITAPGAMIASARSSQASHDVLLDLGDGEHTLAAGTSMATPFVSGTIAMMFSADPSYTFEDARRYITESAYVDEFVGTAPNDSWGYGKLDILAAVQTAVLGGPTGNTSANADLSAPQSDGADGSSSCTLMPKQALGSHAVPMIISILSMAAVIWSTRRKRKK